MKLDGQRASTSRDQSTGRARLDDGGYILVALLVGIAIASIWMAAALPSWRQQAIREKEAELIFRGEQYARAILLYQQKMNNALPSSFEDLLSQHVLRKKWKDPITDEDFLPKVGCFQGLGGAPGGGFPGGVPGRGTPGGTTPGRGGPLSSPIQPPGRGGSTTTIPPSPQIPGGGRGPSTPGGQFPSGQFPGGQIPGGQMPGGQFPGGFGGQQGQGGICGVQSKSKAASIKIYNGQQEYDLWQFDTTTARLLFQKNVMAVGGVGGAPGQGIGLPVNMPGGPAGRQGFPGNRGFPGGFPGGLGGRGGPGGGVGPGGPGGAGPGRGGAPGGSQPPVIGGGRGR